MSTDRVSLASNKHGVDDIVRPRWVTSPAPGYRQSVPPEDPVPEADRLEQEQPVAPEAHPEHRARPDAAEEDVFEQELPLADAATDTGIDADRSEPLDDDRDATGRG